MGWILLLLSDEMIFECEELWGMTCVCEFVCKIYMV